MVYVRSASRVLPERARQRFKAGPHSGACKIFFHACYVDFARSREYAKVPFFKREQGFEVCAMSTNTQKPTAAALLREVTPAIAHAAERGHQGCLRALQRLLEVEGDGGPVREIGFDPEHLSPSEIESITGIARQQWGRWASGGMPVNPDRSYDLRVALTWMRANAIGRPRTYRQQPSAIEKRIIAKLQSVLHDELSRVQVATPKDKHDTHKE